MKTTLAEAIQKFTVNTECTPSNFLKVYTDWLFISHDTISVGHTDH